MTNFLFVHPQVGILHSGHQVVTRWGEDSAARLLDTLWDQSPDWAMRAVTPEETVRMHLYSDALKPWKAEHLSLNLEQALKIRGIKHVP